MPNTDAVALRDKERTRKALIDAATKLFFERGAGVSLADIAAAAGVSKGALMHHFPHRSDLERAVHADGGQRFWDAVITHVDLSENRPGKLLRGYIRALTSDDALRHEFFSLSASIAILGTGTGAGAEYEDVFIEDARRWREAFAADGMDPATTAVLRTAAEGLALAADSPYLTADELRAASARLLEMAEPGHG